MGRCKVGYSIGNFNPDPAPGVWTSVKDASYWLDYDEDNDGDIYEFLLPKCFRERGSYSNGCCRSSNSRIINN